jgi:hypothetical protein
MSLRHTTFHRPITCRVCGLPLDGATSAVPGQEDHRPGNHSFSVCIGCGEVSMFVVEDGEVVGLREPNFVELEIFNREFAREARVAAQVRAEHGRGQRY